MFLHSVSSSFRYSLLLFLKCVIFISYIFQVIIVKLALFLYHLLLTLLPLIDKLFSLYLTLVFAISVSNNLILAAVLVFFLEFFELCYLSPLNLRPVEVLA